MKESPQPPVAQTRGSVQSLKTLMGKEIAFRLLVFSGISIALALALWSVFGVWFPVQRESGKLTEKIGKLSGDIDRLQSKWGDSRTGRIRDAYRKVVHSHVLLNESAFSHWLAQLQTNSAALRLNLEAHLDKAVAAPANEEAPGLVPLNVSLTVSPNEGGAESPYERLLRLSQDLAAQSKHTDITRLTVQGGPGSASRADLVCRIWALVEKEK